MTIRYFTILGFSLLLLSNPVMAQTLFESYRLSNPSVAGATVLSYEISSDQSRVVYVANQDFSDRFELFSAPIKGGPSTRLSAVTSGPSAVSKFKISPDGTRVVFIQNTGTGIFNMYVSRINGGGLISFGQQVVNMPHNVLDFKFSPNGEYVAYRMQEPGSDKINLYQIRVGDAVNVTRPSNPQGGLGQVQQDYQYTREGYLIFVASPPLPSANTNLRLYSQAPVTSTNRPDAQQISSTDNGRVESFVVANNANNIVYNVFSLSLQTLNTLVSVSADGSSSPLTVTTSNDQEIFEDYKLSDDGQYVIYRSRPAFDQPTTIQSRALSGPLSVFPPLTVNAPFITGNPKIISQGVGSFQISPDSQTVVYELFSVNPEPPSFTNLSIQVFSSPILGGASVELGSYDAEDWLSNGKLVAGSEAFTRNSKRVMISGDSRPVVANADAANLVGLLNDRPLIGQNIVIQIAEISSSKRFTFIVRDGFMRSRLFLRDLDMANFRQLSSELTPTSAVGPKSFHISSKGDYIVYLSDVESQNRFQLYAVRVAEEELCLPIKAKNGSIASICL